MNVKDHVSSVKGIGPKKAEALNRMGIHTIQDFLYFYPRGYQDRRQITKIGELENGSLALIQGKIKLKVKGGYGKKQTLKLLVSDDSGSAEIVFFNARFLIHKFEIEEEFTFYGRVAIEYGKTKMIHPEFLKKDEKDGRGIIPIYPLTAGVSQSDMYKWQNLANGLLSDLQEYLTEDIVQRNKLCDLQYALDNIHFPPDKNHLKAAKYRLVFDELLFLQIGLQSVKNRITAKEKGTAFHSDVKMEEFVTGLSYSLTGAQKKVLAEINGDMESDKVMNRLVQGDVGSGKTVVAEAALYKAVKSGFQGVLMAPTELLARQHFESLREEFGGYGIEVGFLSGSMSAKNKKETLERLANGNIQVLVGTHALIQPSVLFKNLGLVITDEQHRFGVNQRNLLTEKGKNPDVLVMTATPIPRTLAVILYGDLDISVIDELPPGRQKIITNAFKKEKREQAYSFVRQQIRQGRQAYVVAPLIEESETLENVISAEELYRQLRKSFPEVRTALLHGEMKQAEKDAVMEKFYTGEIEMLVSTVVIEVGINVPNATIMVIENAERFGLAQLHQLRGRVGRGKDQSYCLLISGSESSVSKERIEIMVSTSDGFVIAEKDLKLRGPGEFFGLRQHGLPDLKLADLGRHMGILNQTKEEAKKILERDPKLLSVEMAGIKQKTIELFGENAVLSI
ncbi:ATP-dependent DNA helicase RecG [Aminipila luticellarii]|uniref:ATP-dependent DNA helicase RecG n=1 Tax=Aminipila luticellarii TaxID=2507160 RepID=A0A410PVB8_9FIRM|nr:ATP-dependent DNA helicase RecG [Aminipila luticellarii]QAT42806.1 ATP-dependent DNA helicase RecG [Aminipila luticellarii]